MTASLRFLITAVSVISSSIMAGFAWLTLKASDTYFASDWSAN